MHGPTEMSFTVWEESEEIMGSQLDKPSGELYQSCPNRHWTCCGGGSRFSTHRLQNYLVRLALKADVVLERADGNANLWIQFDVSRA